MTVPREQEVLTQFANERSIDPVCDLLSALGYEDVARELRLRWDQEHPWDDDE